MAGAPRNIPAVPTADVPGGCGGDPQWAARQESPTPRRFLGSDRRRPQAGSSSRIPDLQRLRHRAPTGQTARSSLTATCICLFRSPTTFG
jgi:hypothetical protein